MAGNSTKNFFDKKREWSTIKDDLLGGYLVPYSAKLFNSRRDIVYIDAFAGEGKFKDDTLGSPLIAYKIFVETKEKKDIASAVNFVFIENENYESLSDNTKACKKCEVISNDYEKVIEELLKKQKDKNIFLYVDPFGIKNIKMDYFVKANSSGCFSSEILLNFNSFGFIREGCRLFGIDDAFEDVEDESFIQNIKLVDDEKNDVNNMNAIAGGEYWQTIIKKLKDKEIDGYEAEKTFAKEYCKKFKENTNYKYVINLPIRVNQNNHPKYRMVFATNHSDGLILMAEGMIKRHAEMKLRQNKGMLSLFEETVENEIIEQNKIESMIINSLTSNDEVDINDIYINVIEEVGIYSPAKIRGIISLLEKSSKVKVKRDPAFTEKGKVSTFLTTAKNNKVFVSV